AQETPTFQLLNRKPVVADQSEIEANPRARSAKLRGAERTAAPARLPPASSSWPRLADVLRGG
ncbi:16S rRNA (cytosine(1402)-N(4))-methyltransferase, partial [Bradyrhizobium sp.]